jgi:predicted Zn-dependent protease with MMP-like domain
MKREHFVEAVEAALDSLPQEFRSLSFFVFE